MKFFIALIVTVEMCREEGGQRRNEEPINCTGDLTSMFVSLLPILCASHAKVLPIVSCTSAETSLYIVLQDIAKYVNETKRDFESQKTISEIEQRYRN